MPAAPAERVYGLGCLVPSRSLPDQLELGARRIGTAHLDYLTFMAQEAAIKHMRTRRTIPDDSQFARLECRHFRPNARHDSEWPRTPNWLPGIAPMAGDAKRRLGRDH